MRERRSGWVLNFEYATEPPGPGRGAVYRSPWLALLLTLGSHCFSPLARTASHLHGSGGDGGDCSLRSSQQRGERRQCGITPPPRPPPLPPRARRTRRRGLFAAQRQLAAQPGCRVHRRLPLTPREGERGRDARLSRGVKTAARALRRLCQQQLRLLRPSLRCYIIGVERDTKPSSCMHQLGLSSGSCEGQRRCWVRRDTRPGRCHQRARGCSTRSL